MSKEKWPVGQGQLLNQTAEKLPAVEVDNEVIWINPNISSPFKFEMGKRCPLGLLLLMRNTPLPQSAKKTEIEIWEGHSRSGILGRVVTSDKQGHLYRDIDLKGIGMFGYQIREAGHETAPRGLLDYPCALQEAEMAEELHQLGIKTARTLAIIKLNCLIEDNQARPVSWFTGRGYIYPPRIPVVAVRAFTVKTRLADLNLNTLYGTKSQTRPVPIQIADTISLIEWQFGEFIDINDRASYLVWLAKTAGRQLGLLHRAGYCHHYLSSHNITADGTIVDYDSVERESREFTTDFLKLKTTIRDLAGGDYATAHKIYCALEESYTLGKLGIK